MTQHNNTIISSSDIKIYFADLAAYNSGRLHGIWIDATQDLDDIWEQVNQMLKNSPEGFAEEYAIHDYEGFGSYRLNEFQGLESAHNIAVFIEEHGAIGSGLLNHFNGDLDEAKRAVKEHYAGCFQSLADYAEHLTEQTSTVPKNLAFYIDYERMARDMEMNGDIYALETRFDEVHIFWNH